MINCSPYGRYDGFTDSSFEKAGEQYTCQGRSTLNTGKNLYLKKKLSLSFPFANYVETGTKRNRQFKSYFSKNRSGTKTVSRKINDPTLDINTQFRQYWRN